MRKMAAALGDAWMVEACRIHLEAKPLSHDVFEIVSKMLE
jgi:hypothetical protein